MKKVLTSAQMKKCDMQTIEKGTPSHILMERAAKAVFDLVTERYPKGRALVVASSGNNGGDGLVVAMMLKRSGRECDVWYVGHGHRMTEETEKRYSEATLLGVSFVSDPIIDDYTVVVDAVLGTGLSFEPCGLVKEAIVRIKNSKAATVCIDIPSGISADTGNAPGAYVRADYTVTMEAYKRGHTQGEGVDASGTVTVADIGVDTSYVESEYIALALEKRDLSLVPRRRLDSHKGDYGRVLVIGGKKGMCGAVLLSAMSAYRSGAGIVEIFTCEENRQILQTALPEAIVTSYTDPYKDRNLLNEAMERATVIVLGPGLGVDKESEFIVSSVFDGVQASLIVDADALNTVAKAGIQYPTEVPVIITPHPGELARLTGLGVKDIGDDLWRVAEEYARRHGVICVAKNARTVISDGENLFVNMHGTPALAKGGSGDVLTGVIAGMLCLGMSPIGAGTVGVLVHSLAGEAAAELMGSYSPLARDVIDSIPVVLKNAGGNDQWQS